jgi:hypothetical protein
MVGFLKEKRGMRFENLSMSRYLRDGGKGKIVFQTRTAQFCNDFRLKSVSVIEKTKIRGSDFPLKFLKIQTNKP